MSTNLWRYSSTHSWVLSIFSFDYSVNITGVKLFAFFLLLQICKCSCPFVHVMSSYLPFLPHIQCVCVRERVRWRGGVERERDARPCKHLIQTSSTGGGGGGSSRCHTGAVLLFIWCETHRPGPLHIYVSAVRTGSGQRAVRMRAGARPPPRDAVRCLCLVAILCAQAAVTEGGVYHGESNCFTEEWLIYCLGKATWVL